MADTMPLLPGLPWAITWERDPRIDDGHPHHWEVVVVSRPGWDGRREAVVRCVDCQAPRCGSAFDADPCLLRRHHRSGHHHELTGHRALGA